MAHLWETPEPTRESVLNGEPTLVTVKTQGILHTPKHEVIALRDLLALAGMRLALLNTIHFLETPDLRLPCPTHADAKSGNVGSTHVLKLDKNKNGMTMPKHVPSFSAADIPRLQSKYLDP